MISDGKIIAADLRVPEGGLNNIVQISADVRGEAAAPVNESKYWDDSFLSP